MESTEAHRAFLSCSSLDCRNNLQREEMISIIERSNVCLKVMRRKQKTRENLENPFAPRLFEIARAEPPGRQCLVQDCAAHPGKHEERCCFHRQKKTRSWIAWRLEGSGAAEGPHKQTRQRLLSFGSLCSSSGLWSSLICSTA